jgi:hypothetical protein
MERRKMKKLQYILGLFLFVGTANAQMVPHYVTATYVDVNADATEVTILQSLTGYATAPSGFPPNTTHTPHVYVTVNGQTASLQGNSVCPSCNVSAEVGQSFNVDLSTFDCYLNNDIETPDCAFDLNEAGGYVVCSAQGSIFSGLTGSGRSRFIQAYYQCTDWTGGQCAADANGLRPYARCNPQGDFCDSEKLGVSPVTDGGWPQYGLFNAVFINLPVVDACYIGTHGTRADKCYSPDPHP